MKLLIFQKQNYPILAAYLKKKKMKESVLNFANPLVLF